MAMAVVYPALMAANVWFEGRPWDGFAFQRVLTALALPLLLSEMVLLAHSPRAETLVGPRHMMMRWLGTGLPWGLVMILALWPLEADEIGPHILIWLSVSVVFAWFLGRQFNQDQPDLADRFFALEKLRSGSWIDRTDYLWWPLVWVPLLVWIGFTHEGPDDGLGQGWIVFQLAFLPSVVTAPRQKAWPLKWIDGLRITGAALLLAAFLGLG